MCARYVCRRKSKLFNITSAFYSSLLLCIFSFLRKMFIVSLCCRCSAKAICNNFRIPVEQIFCVFYFYLEMIAVGKALWLVDTFNDTIREDSLKVDVIIYFFVFYLWMFSISLKLPPLVWILLTEPGAILLINLHKMIPSRRTSSYGWPGNFSPKTASIHSMISCSCSLLRPCFDIEKKTKRKEILIFFKTQHFVFSIRYNGRGNFDVNIWHGVTLWWRQCRPHNYGLKMSSTYHHFRYDWCM